MFLPPQYGTLREEAKSYKSPTFDLYLAERVCNRHSFWSREKPAHFPLVGKPLSILQFFRARTNLQVFLTSKHLVRFAHIALYAGNKFFVHSVIPPRRKGWVWFSCSSFSGQPGVNCHYLKPIFSANSELPRPNERVSLKVRGSI